MEITGIDLFNKGISDKRFLSHSASMQVMSKAINSDFMVERDMRICLVDFQATTAPPKVKTYPLVA